MLCCFSVFSDVCNEMQYYISLKLLSEFIVDFYFDLKIISYASTDFGIFLFYV